MEVDVDEQRRTMTNGEMDEGMDIQKEKQMNRQTDRWTGMDGQMNEGKDRLKQSGHDRRTDRLSQ